MMTSATRIEGMQEEQEKMKNLNEECDASISRASASSDRKDKTVMITNIKGFDRLKSYAGDASQWKDWRFRIGTWLAHIKPSFEALTKTR